MTKLDEVLLLDAIAQAELIRKKDIQPIELVEAAIDKIQALNPKLNAIITPIFEKARDTVKGDIPKGPFSGVPFLIKDCGAAVYKGVPMALGTSLLRNYVPNYDSELTIRYKKAGLITLGKTNVPELVLLPTTEPVAFGPTRNPWDHDRSTGGSSGGSAAAVAAGLVPMAHSGDGGGSIRIPASCCGVFGLKPTRARIPFGPDYGDIMSGMVCDHVISRSVRDSAAILDATCGPDVGDPYWAPPPKRAFLEEVGADPGRLRIAFSTEVLNNGPVHPDCIKAVHEAATLCESLGHIVEERPHPALSSDFKLMLEAWNVVWGSGFIHVMDSIKRMVGIPLTYEHFEPYTWALYEDAIQRQNSGGDYLRAIQLFQQENRKAGRFFEEFDVMLTLVVTEPPVPIGTFTGNSTDVIDRMAAYSPLCGMANMSGQPAMSVPLFWNDDGLPIGSHFFGRFGDEATLFRLAAQLEKAQPWKNKRPCLKKQPKNNLIQRQIK